MSSQDDDQDNRVVVLVLIAAVLLAVGVAVGVGINKSRGAATAAKGATEIVEKMDAGAHATEGHGDAAASAAPAAEAAAPATAAATSEGASAEAAVPAPAAPAATEDASVVIENGVVKFYFASGKSDLASGAVAALGDAIAAAKSGKRLVLSGFHDASGNPAKNAELAKQRALSVRSALLGAGVAESSLELKKPEMAVGSGNPAEARRVEVTIVE